MQKGRTSFYNCTISSCHWDSSDTATPFPHFPFSDYISYVFSKVPVRSISNTQKISHFSKKCLKKAVCPGLPKWQHVRTRSHRSVEHESRKKIPLSHFIQVTLLTPVLPPVYQPHVCWRPVDLWPSDHPGLEPAWWKWKDPVATYVCFHQLLLRWNMDLSIFMEKFTQVFNR